MQKLKTLLTTAVLSGTLVLPGLAASAEHIQPASLSPELLELLRAEMRELLLGTQAIATALPIGDWDGVVATARQMKASYILVKKLTPSQKTELAALPEHFKYLDERLHTGAEKLAEAAARKDMDTTSYHYSRLIETCMACHASFALPRFPGLRSASQDDHHHH